MTAYKLIGVGVNGGEDWGCDPIYLTRERAEKQKEIEISAYTEVNGVKKYDCPYDFEVVEIEVEGQSMDRVHIVACVSEDSYVNVDSVWLDFNLAYDRWAELEEQEWEIISTNVNKGQYTLDQEVEAVEVEDGDDLEH